MTTYAITTLQTAIYIAAAGYIVRPEVYQEKARSASQRSSDVLRELCEPYARKTVTAIIEAVQTVRTRLPEHVPMLQGLVTETEPSTVSGAATAAPAEESAGYQRPRCDSVVESEPEVTETATLEPVTDPEIPTTPSISTRAPCPPEGHFHPPSNIFPPSAPVKLLPPSKAELDQILTRLVSRRKHRLDQTRRRIQLYRNGTPGFEDEVPKKKAKKRVRFALDTKPGSEGKQTKEEDKLISPLPPPDSELDIFAAALTVPNGSVFSRPEEFNEAYLIRKLPAQLKNGAGGIAYCVGRTVQGLYALETPVKRLLLDLKAGVCYDGLTGRSMDVDEMMKCVLWGRGEVVERWGGLAWTKKVA